MKTLISFLAATLIGFAATAQSTELLFQQYIQVKDALVSSDSRAAAVQAAALQQMLETSWGGQEYAPLLQSAKNIAATTDLNTQRKVFAVLSVSVWQIVKSKGGIQRTVYYQYCPMKKAYWLSQDATIRNPYYGAQMLTCGSVSDKKHP
ncbi:MAG TPA: DUF3347 domain-containing protein [Saprospiraceae bacterium]|nr:DUF3347 domain-containing protein [Saprospiraceae bacterium]